MDQGCIVVFINTLVFDGGAHLIGHPLDAGQGFQFVGLTLRWSAIRAAVLNLLSIAAVKVKPNNLSLVGRGACPAAANDDGHTAIEFIGEKQVLALQRSMLFHPHKTCSPGRSCHRKTSCERCSDVCHGVRLTRCSARSTALRSAPSARPKLGPSM